MNWIDRPAPETLHPVIVTTGPEGYPAAQTMIGLCAARPVIGEPVTLYDSRHIWSWSGSTGGLFGFALTGTGGKLSPAVPASTHVCRSWLLASPAAWARVSERAA